MLLPAGWREMRIDQFRQQIADMAEGLSGPMQAMFAMLLDDIDQGRVRLVAAGPSGFDGWTGTMIVQVQEGDASLDEAVARISSELDGGERTSRETQLEIGAAVRIATLHPLPSGAPVGSIPSRTIEYVARLDGGETLWLMATGPAAAIGFDALIDPAVETLRRR